MIIIPEYRTVFFYVFLLDHNYCLVNIYSIVHSLLGIVDIKIIRIYVHICEEKAWTCIGKIVKEIVGSYQKSTLCLCLFIKIDVISSLSV